MFAQSGGTRMCSNTPPHVVLSCWHADRMLYSYLWNTAICTIDTAARRRGAVSFTDISSKMLKPQLSII